MNKLEKIILYSLLVISVILGVVNLKSNSLGAYIDSGQVSTFTDMNVTNDLVVNGNFIQGGSIAAITQSSAAATTTAANICNNSILNVTITNATGTNTIYVPTAATLISTCLTGDGMSKTVYLRNTGSSVATSTVVTTNTGITLRKSGNTGGTLSVAATSTAALRFLRTSSTAVDVYVDPYIN